MIKAEYSRKDFSIIKKQFKEIGKGNVRLTQSSLILLQPISPTKTVYTFPVLENDNATGVRPQEIKLNQNDEFSITQLGVYAVGTLSYPSGEEVISKDGLIYMTHAAYNQNDTDAYKIKPLWNGYLKIAVNNIVYVDKFDTIKSEQTQRTQFQDRNATELNGATVPSISMETDGMNQLAPTIQLSGAKKNEISLILNDAISPVDYVLKNNENVAVTVSIKYVGLIMRGLLGQNAASFQTPGVRK